MFALSSGVYFLYVPLALLALGCMEPSHYKNITKARKPSLYFLQIGFFLKYNFFYYHQIFIAIENRIDVVRHHCLLYATLLI